MTLTTVVIQRKIFGCFCVKQEALRHYLKSSLLTQVGGECTSAIIKKIRINYIEYILTFFYKTLYFTLSCCGKFFERQKSRALVFDGSD